MKFEKIAQDSSLLCQRAWGNPGSKYYTECGLPASYKVIEGILKGITLCENHVEEARNWSE